MRETALSDIVRQLAAVYVAGLRERADESEEKDTDTGRETRAAGPNKRAESEVA